MNNSTRADGTIAAYLADHEAIEARWSEFSKRLRLADLEAEAAGVEPDGPKDYNYSQFKADLEGCEARHFPGIDPRTGVGLTTTARLWRWIVHIVPLTENILELESRNGTDWGVSNPEPFWVALKAAYRCLHELDSPDAPERPYVQPPEDEARDALRSISNRLRARAETDDRWLTVSQAATVANVDSGVISRAADLGKLKSNNEKGRDRLIDGIDLNRWILARSNRSASRESNKKVQSLIDQTLR